MKFRTIFALFGAAVATTTNEKELVLREDLEGLKSFYDGYYKSFYKVNKSDSNLDKCMDDTTIHNMLSIGMLIENPLSLFSITNFTSNIQVFGSVVEVAGDLYACTFWSTALDLWNICSSEKNACAMETITENLTKNMFVLMGKLTSMAETLKGYPSKEEDEFREQMRELGSDAGTFLRVIYNYESPEYKAEKARE